MHSYILLTFATACVLTLYNIHTSRPPRMPSSARNEKLRTLRDTIAPRHYNILSLGGSATGGMNLVHHTHSYPFILGSPPTSVTTASVDAMDGGSFYPSLCLEGMVGSNTVFDLVLLEFSLTGFEGIELLLKRIRHHFPDAVIIYVHLYNLQTDLAEIEDKDGSFVQPAHDPTDPNQYHWGYGESVSEAVLNDLRKLLDKYDARTFSLPRPDNVVESLAYFDHDWLHLSQEGHNAVAEGVLNILKDVPEKSGVTRETNATLMGTTDKCYSWFINGRVPFRRSPKVRLASFDASGGPRKVYALEFPKGGVVTIINNLNSSVPLYMFFMSQSEAYPIVKITMKKMAKTVDPMIRSNQHLMKSEQIGWLGPGENEVVVKPITDSVMPFRITGFALCEACIHLEGISGMRDTLNLA